MKRFVVSRIVAAVPVVLAVIVLSFFLLHIVPGDPVTALVGEFPAPPEYIAEMRHAFGLDQSLGMQLWLYASHLAQGDFGFSFANQQPVLSLVVSRALLTLLLMIPALVASSVLGILLALLATQGGAFFDRLVTVLSLIGYSAPVFWLGQILIIVFAVDLHWLPAQGMVSLRGLAPGFLPRAWDITLHWILPGSAVTVFYAGVVARVARTSLREAINQDFVTTARAKGLGEREVLWKHILPNAMIPVVSVIGYNFSHAITGTIMVEAVFAWPGLGGLFLSSISTRDYPVLQGIFIFAAFTVILANLLTDLLYGVVDPRIRHGRPGT